MNIEHKIIREILREMYTKPDAREVLENNLPEKEWKAIYYNDVEQEDQFWIAELLNKTDSSVKKYKERGYKKIAPIIKENMKSGYEKLAAFYFPKNK